MKSPGDAIYGILSGLDLLRVLTDEDAASLLNETEEEKQQAIKAAADTRNGVVAGLRALADHLEQGGAPPKIVDQGYPGDNGEPWFEIADEEVLK